MGALQMMLCLRCFLESFFLLLLLPFYSFFISFLLLLSFCSFFFMHTHIIFVLYILHTSFLLLLLVFRGVFPLWTVLYLLRLALGGKDPSDGS